MALRSENTPLSASASVGNANPGLSGTSLVSREHQDSHLIAPAQVRLPHGAAEVFRRIYTRAQVRGSGVLAICSAIAGEGKTTVGLGLGLTFAQDFPDRRVLLAETDVERPVLASDLQLDPTPGLLDCLLDDRPVQVAYRGTARENFHLLPSGGPAMTSSRILRSSRMAAAVDAMRQTHDLVILDIPAVLTCSDAPILAELADGVIFVVRAGATPLHLVRKALRDVDQRLFRGVVLNGAASSIPPWLQRLCEL